MRLICARVLMAACCWLGVFEASAGAADGLASGYVVVENGHLSRDGQRVRLWGVNLQSGVFRSYEEIDRLVVRLKALGFNAVRLWPTPGTFYRVDRHAGVAMNASTAGDGSDLDRFDYLVWQLSEAGISIQMTMLHYLEVDTIRNLPDPEIRQWTSTGLTDRQARTVHGFAPYVSKAYRARLMLHARRMLQRVNPYSQRRYADEPAVSTWELANEALFVSCALSEVCLDELPVVARAELESAWRESSLNPAHMSLPFGVGGKTTSANYRRFVVQTFIAASEEMRANAKTIGGVGSGVAVQPFIFSTGPIAMNGLGHYAYSAGDVMSVGAYHSPLMRGVSTSPWQPISLGGPTIPFLEYVKIEHKPLVVYETSFFRPYSYRAEWGPVMAAIGIRQDWDAVFLYAYGQPWAIYDGTGAPEGYGRRPLPVPMAGMPGDQASYTFGFHHAGDPVAMASWSVGAGLFLSADDTNRLPEVVWDISDTSLYGTSNGYPAKLLTPGNVKRTPRLKQVALRFVGARAERCLPCTSTALTVGDTVDWSDGLRVKTKAAHVFVGSLEGSIPILGSSLDVDVLTPGFGVLALVERPAQSEADLYLIGDANNTGFKLDAERVNYASPAGAMVAVVARGGAPLERGGPAVSVKLGSRWSSISATDFSLDHEVPIQGDGPWALRASDEFFRYRLYPIGGAQ